MPSIIPGYVYTLFAALVVGAIIVVGCTMATLNVRTQAVNQQLSNVEQYVAAQSLALVTQVTEDNQNITQVLNLPSQVGNQVYWVSLGSDTIGVDVTGGLGSTEVIGSQSGVSIPAQVAASGTYSSTSGRALLQCSVENQTVTLMLMEID